VDALARARSGARLKIAGSGPLETELRRQIARLGVEDRVELLGFVSATELVELYAGCRAACYAPLNEDYGYVTVEAFLSRKPVLTTGDAGGPLEFVSDGETGIVAAPSADAVAEAIDRLWEMPASRLREMGEAGYVRVREITWDRAIDLLTEGL
jgi:glycosyltransferase involved in cell wall biosynthesis